MASQFDRLSDCMLLCLLEYLDGTALYQLSQVSTRFEEIVLEKNLWKIIDGRNEPNDEKKINYILDRVHDLTEILLMRGRKVYDRATRMIQEKSFKSLTILALENQFINQQVRLGDFPSTLEEVSFKNSVFDLSSEFFRKSSDAMENLRVLIIDGCLHVSTSTLMSVSKYPNLEIFSCYKCPMENSIAYFSIAVSNGFRKIKVFDIRLSGLGNTFLKAFMKKSTVSVMYFQNSDKSYETDFRHRAVEASKSNVPVPKVIFNTLSTVGNEDNLVTDLGTLDFSRTIPLDDEFILPKSYLYTYPYRPCTCGFKEKQEANLLGIDDQPLSMSAVYVRGNERKQIEIVRQENVLGDDDYEDYVDYERGTGNGDTEEGQFCEMARYSGSSSAIDFNSPLDARDRNASRACTEIIYTVLPRKETKDQSVGTDAVAPTTSHQPSTSGLSLRKRKNGKDAAGAGAKRAKTDDGDSSSSDDDNDREVVLRRPPLSALASMAGPSANVVLRNPLHDDIAARLMASSEELIVSKVPRADPPTRRAAGPSNNRNRRAVLEVSSSRYKTRNSPREDATPDENVSSDAEEEEAPPPPPVVQPPPRPAQPARTQVFQCACGAHSVIVVTADETANGAGPSYHQLENNFHPHHCEQRINLNDHQSLRVINRNELPNARPEVELVDLNKEQALKTSLKHLSFRGYHRVTNLSLRSVEHLHLSLIDLTYTQCTKEGVLDFLRLNPNCRVVHKDFCVCRPNMDF